MQHQELYFHLLTAQGFKCNKMKKVLLLTLFISMVAGKHTPFSTDTQGRQEREFLELESDQSCGEHEEWVTCHSSSCFDNICEEVLDPNYIRRCTRDCRRGCACKSGYVREDDGVCYDEEICFGYYE